jgi:hypothetical protein
LNTQWNRRTKRPWREVSGNSWPGVTYIVLTLPH